MLTIFLDVEFLKEAYYKLDPEVSLDNEESSIDVENFSQSLFVECAEKAINVIFFRITLFKTIPKRKI